MNFYYSLENLIKNGEDDKDKGETEAKKKNQNLKKCPLILNLIKDFKACLPHFNFYNPKKIKILKSILKIANKQQIVKQCYMSVLTSGKKEIILNKTRFKTLSQFLNVLFNKDNNSCLLINKLRYLFKNKYPKTYSMYFL